MQDASIDIPIESLMLFALIAYPLSTDHRVPHITQLVCKVMWEEATRTALHWAGHHYLRKCTMCTYGH